MKNLFLIAVALLAINCEKSPTTDDTTPPPPPPPDRVNLGRENVLFQSRGADVFDGSYNEKYEQPNWLWYASTNRPKNVDRNDGGYNWHIDEDIYTSDNDDYANNEWDRGHLAPAATFSDSQPNLYSTFNFLNCSLQVDTFNRGVWNSLEQSERVWDDEQDLSIRIDLRFDEGHQVLPTGGHIPSHFTKHIFFNTDQTYRCFEFENKSYPSGTDYEDYEVNHNHTELNSRFN